MLGHMEPPFFWGGGRRRSAMAPLERAMIVSYRVSIVTVALSVTIRSQFVIECLQRSNQQGVGSDFGPKFRGKNETLLVTADAMGVSQIGFCVPTSDIENN